MSFDFEAYTRPSEITKCPKCKCDELHRDEADVGVGIIYGPWGCPQCGWSEHPSYDLSEGKDPVDIKGGAIDQYGGYHPPGSSMALAYRLAKMGEEEYMELKVDRARYSNRRALTGILVRAMGLNDKYISVDIADLDKASLLIWLKSRGGDNKWAEDCVGILLGHGALHDPT